MKFVEWCGLFVIGHPVIDKQHRELFRLANSFIDNIRHSAADRNNAFRILNGLIKYAEDHFSEEEEIARQYKCPEEELSKHEEAHAKLIEEIFEINDRLQKAESFEINSIEKFLREWLVMHVLNEDLKLKKYVSG